MADFSQIPIEMRQAKRWLVWCNKSGRKLPYYISGKERGRGGVLDNDKDIKQLSTFDDAVKAFNTGKYSGIGFALGKDGEGYWQGIDLDKVTENKLLSLASQLPSYVEVSPSKNGFHAIGYGKEFKSLGSNGTGTEAYTGKRYFTVTGQKVRGELCDVSEFVNDVLINIHDAKNNPCLESSEVSEVLEVLEVLDAREEGREKSILNIPSLSDLPDRCKPNAIGRRHETIFKLARHLKSLNPNAKPLEFRDYVREWFEKCLNNIGTKDFSITWVEFKNAWTRIKTLEGDAGMTEIVNKVNFDTVAPPELSKLFYEGSSWTCVQLCYLLSKCNEDGVFFLSSYKIQELLKIPQRSACNVLTSMVDDGILIIIKKGTTRLATRYKYIGVALDI